MCDKLIFVLFKGNHVDFASHGRPWWGGGGGGGGGGGDDFVARFS